MIEQQVEIINRLGLHARAATRLVNCASNFESEIMFSRDDREINGKSIMGVLMLAAAQGVTLTVRIDGPDEQDAMRAIVELIGDRFGEGE